MLTKRFYIHEMRRLSEEQSNLQATEGVVSLLQLLWEGDCGQAQGLDLMDLTKQVRAS